MQTRAFGFQLDRALDFVVISVQHVVFIRAHSIGNRLAARELASGFDIDVHVFERHQCRINHDAHCQRIVHRGSLVAALLRARQVEVGQLRDEIALRTVQGLQDPPDTCE